MDCGIIFHYWMEMAHTLSADVFAYDYTGYAAPCDAPSLVGTMFDMCTTLSDSVAAATHNACHCYYLELVSFYSRGTSIDDHKDHKATFLTTSSQRR